MKYAFYLAVVLAGLLVAALLVVAVVAALATMRDEWRRRREKDLPPRAALAKAGRPLEPGWDGYTIEGPDDALETVLLGEQRVAILREVLARLKSGSAEPIPMRI